MTPERFAPPARILHWLMAALILAMLLIGAGMLSTTTARYPDLLAWHRPVGIAILILALVRLGVRLTHRPPPLPTCRRSRSRPPRARMFCSTR
jgi:cytochrome b561